MPSSPSSSLCVSDMSIFGGVQALGTNGTLRRKGFCEGAAAHVRGYVCEPRYEGSCSTGCTKAGQGQEGSPASQGGGQISAIDGRVLSKTLDLLAKQGSGLACGRMSSSHAGPHPALRLLASRC